jgi:predicted amidohydrolase
MKEEKIIKAGVIQFDVKFGDVDSNIETALDGIKDLWGRGVEIVVLPELWSCGFDNRRLADYAVRTPEIIEKLAKKASEYNMVIAGSLPELSEDVVYNTCYMINGDGTLAGSYRKVHLFSPAGEDKYFGMGETASVYNTTIGKVGMIVCYDLRFPEICRTLALEGAEIILVSAQWPIARIKHWDTLMQARALENQLFIVAANRCGRDKNLEYGGHSQIVSCTGEVLAKAENEPSIFEADLDFNALKRFRSDMPCFKDRVPAAYRT